MDERKLAMLEEKARKADAAEQIVRDVVASAFNSAGQRCSALRVLFVQADIADKVNAGRMVQRFPALAKAARFAFAVIYLQLFFGALVRHTVANEGWEPVVYIASFSAAFRDTIFKGQTGRLDAVEKLY